MRSLAYLLLTLAVIPLDAREIIVRSPQGEPIIVDIRSEESFVETLEVLENTFGVKDEFVIDFQRTAFAKAESRKAAEPIRNYYVAMTAKEKEDLSFIINTLGSGDLIKVAKNRSKLKKAGDRIDHLHPLRFLMGIFTDEQMKVSMTVIDGKFMVWDGFLGGLEPSCETETNRNNMTPEMVADFAKQVGVDFNLIYPAIANRQWVELVHILMAHVPRKGNGGGINI